MSDQQQPPTVAIPGPMEVLNRAIVYIIEGIAIAVACFLVPKKKPSGKEIAMIAITAAGVFLILDTFAPSISQYSRSGAGLALGSSLVGGLRII